MAKHPLIGVTVDHMEHPTETTESTYTVRANYVTALRLSGATAILLPCDIAAIQSYLRLCDGFLVTGSEPGEAGTTLRQDFESELLQQTRDRHIPTFGICNGMQVMGQMLGGELHSTGQRGIGIDHKPRAYPTAPAHDLTMTPEGFLGHLAGTSTTKVNSYHMQYLSDGGSFDVLARAPDGVVEAIAARNHPFFVGVQWHPEYLLSAFDHALIERFVAACSNPTPSDACRDPGVR